MRRIPLLLLTLSISMICCSYSYGQESISIDWKPLGRYARVGNVSTTLFDSLQDISIIRYRLSRFSTCIANDTGRQADSTSALISRHGGTAGINASYFDMATLIPVTYVKDDGVREGSTTMEEFNLRTDGLLRIRKGHKVFIEKCDTLEYDRLCRRSGEAVAAGPVLLKKGISARESWPDDSFYTSRHPRTVFGTAKNGWGYMIVIDGRSKNAAGATIAETVEIARILGLKEAINLDGGGSSVIWTDEYGTLSHPSDNRRFDHYGQRAVPNVIYIR